MQIEAITDELTAALRDPRVLAVCRSRLPNQPSPSFSEIAASGLARLKSNTSLTDAVALHEFSLSANKAKILYGLDNDWE